MEPEVRLVVMQIELLPGNYHWCAIKDEQKVLSDEICKLLGHKVLYKRKSEAEGILERQSAALTLQLDLCELYGSI